MFIRPVCPVVLASWADAAHGQHKAARRSSNVLAIRAAWIVGRASWVEPPLTLALSQGERGVSLFFLPSSPPFSKVERGVSLFFLPSSPPFSQGEKAGHPQHPLSSWERDRVREMNGDW